MVRYTTVYCFDDSEKHLISRREITTSMVTDTHQAAGVGAEPMTHLSLLSGAFSSLAPQLWGTEVAPASLRPAHGHVSLSVRSTGVTASQRNTLTWRGAGAFFHPKASNTSE